ncbi:hypothetical protein GJ496_004113 [Pomphorhynchus laevis]|nr:hypothetical protein GJ496_004113 [Pomphorhynchus laevis]
MSSSDVQKHSVHTLLFRSLKRTHDFFLHDKDRMIKDDEKALEIHRAIRAKDDYGSVMSVLPELKSDYSRNQELEKGVNVQNPKSLTPRNDDASKSNANYRQSLQCLPYKDQQKQSNSNTALTPRKPINLPRPQWHRPWKLYRVISGHLGWVRCVDVEPGNEWFITGAADRMIKIWDLATGHLKLSLTGHVSTVRGVAISEKQPYLFSAGEDKQVKCWDLEMNKVVRHYHGHLSAVHGLALHPTLDVLVSCGRDCVARLWDMRTKAQIHCLNGHTNTVADVRCQATEPQVITGSHDCTVRLWDIVAGKTRCTLTHHKKSVRSICLHPHILQMVSASPDNVKQWNLPNGEFIQNLSGHNAIINTLAVNDDGVLVSGGDNGSTFLWDWKTGYNFQKIQTKPQPGSIDPEMGIFALAFDKTGSRLLSCESDKTIKMYKEDMDACEEDYPIEWKPDIFKPRVTKSDCCRFVRHGKTWKKTQIWCKISMFFFCEHVSFKQRISILSYIFQIVFIPH